MTKTYRFLLAVAFAAMAFTFSCSSGGDDPDGGRPDTGGLNLPPDLPMAVQDQIKNGVQVYYVNKNSGEIIEQYTGGGNVFVRVTTSTYLPAGKIQGGKLLLNLPAIESKYLEAYDFNRSGGTCEGTISAPANLAGELSPYFYASIPGENHCSSYLRSNGNSCLSYFSSSGTIDGTRTCTSEWGRGHIITWKNVKVENGWNLVGSSYSYENNIEKDTFSSDFTGVSNLEFALCCDC